MSTTDDNWFESLVVRGKRIPHVSKFMRQDFVVPMEVVETQWPSWSLREKHSFAAAFSARGTLGENDQKVLDFLMNNGDSQVWSSIALSVVKHQDRNRALEFIIARLKEAQKSYANYYQALAILLIPQCVPILVDALSKHQKAVDMHPALQAWEDGFFYMDYLFCSAALFKITGQEEYRIKIKNMLGHPDDVIKKMVRMVARKSAIEI